MIKCFCSALLHSVYGIRLKWEPHRERVVWGEGALMVINGTLNLSRKGTRVGREVVSDGEWK